MVRFVYQGIGVQSRVNHNSVYEVVHLDAPVRHFLDLPVLRDRETLEQVLVFFGTKLIREVSDPRSLRYSDWRSPRQSRRPKWRVRSTVQDARKPAPPSVRSWLWPRRLDCSGRSAELAEQFVGLLSGHLMVGLLLGVAERPNPRKIAVRARDAAAAFLQLHPLPKEAPAV